MHTFKCPRSNGQFINPEDRHSYFECQNFIAALIDCPREPLRHRTGYQKHIHRRRQVFDGERCADYRAVRQAPDQDFECPETDGYYADPRNPNYFYICRGGDPQHQQCPVDSRFNETLKRCVEAPAQPVPDIAPLGRPGLPYCPPDSTYDPTTGRCRTEDLIEPISRPVAVDAQPFTRCPSGSTYDPPSGRCVQELLVDPIERDRVVDTGTTTRCPTGSTYDPSSGRCQVITLVDPIREQVLETERVRECPPGYQYDRSIRECRRVVQVDPIGYCPSGQHWDAYRRVCIPNQPIDRRYRRNGRVELEDGVNIIVDTWNELDWKWERNLNGEKILPERNGWVDWNVRPWERRGGYQGNYAGRNGE